MKEPVVIDVEASGLGRGSYPIEVGVALANGDTKCMIIRRQQDWDYWDDEAELLHGITREILDRYGREPADVAQQLNHWLAEQVVYSDAWGNDSSWLALLFDCAGLPQRFKIEPIRSLLTEEQAEQWHSVKDSVTKESGFCRHRACNDAWIIQQTFLQIGPRKPVVQAG